MLCFLFSVLLSLNLYAADAEKVSESKIFPEFVTSFPIVAAVGAGYAVTEKIKLSFSYGIVPELYYSVIAQTAASMSGNSEYEDVIKAAFQNNSLWRISAGYSPENNFSGWHFSLSGTVLNSSGRANIDEVLESSSNNDFTPLKNLLISSGRGTFVDMTAMLQILEIQAAYTWKKSDAFQIDATFGVAKVIGSDISYKTNLSNFENSAAGRQLIRSSESDTESVIENYGITPTVGLAAKYYF